MALAEGVFLNHLARESPDIERLAKFYHEVFGFEIIRRTEFEFDIIWLKLPSLILHLIERNPDIKLPEGPWSATSAVADPENLSRGHHLALSVSNFDSFVQRLKERGVETFQRTGPNLTNMKQVFFFDPDGNGLEANCVGN